MAHPINQKLILIISHMYPRDYNRAGGIFVHEQAKVLRSRGIDARVVSGEPFWINTCNVLKVTRALKSYRNTAMNEWDEFDGVPILRLPYIVSNHLPFKYHAFTYTQGIMRHIKFIYSTFKFNLIHAHTAFLDGSAARKVASCYQVPYLITEHTGPFTTLTGSRYMKKKVKKSIKNADQLIAVSDSLLKEMIKEIPSLDLCHAIVIPNVVDCDLFHMQPAQSNRSNVRNYLQILWVGHFVPVKRVSELLKAFALFMNQCKSNFQFRLKLVGSGEQEQALRQLAQDLNINDSVEFAGQADHNTLATYYNSCDFLIISSESETFGVVAIEAMSCGRPVLSTNCGGPEEIIINEQLGMVVGQSAQEMASGMEDMVERIQDFEPRLIRESALQRFSCDRIGAQLEEIYDDFYAEIV